MVNFRLFFLLIVSSLLADDVHSLQCYVCENCAKVTKKELQTCGSTSTTTEAVDTSTANNPSTYTSQTSVPITGQSGTVEGAVSNNDGLNNDTEPIPAPVNESQTDNGTQSGTIAKSRMSRMTVNLPITMITKSFPIVSRSSSDLPSTTGAPITGTTTIGEPTVSTSASKEITSTTENNKSPSSTSSITEPSPLVHTFTVTSETQTADPIPTTTDGINTVPTTTAFNEPSTITTTDTDYDGFVDPTFTELPSTDDLDPFTTETSVINDDLTTTSESSDKSSTNGPNGITTTDAGEPNNTTTVNVEYIKKLSTMTPNTLNISITGQIGANTPDLAPKLPTQNTNENSKMISGRLVKRDVFSNAIKNAKFVCVTDVKKVNGTKVINRGCAVSSFPNSTCSDAGFSGQCRVCDTDKCNSATYLNLSLLTVFTAIVSNTVR